jgi:uncharacterized protein YggU (UPF0235/DUF167 family)
MMDTSLRDMLASRGILDLVVRVRPGARLTRAKGMMSDGAWKIDVSAAPEDGAANECLRRFLAEEFGVPFACVTVVSGQTSREKRLRVTAPPR